jgi:transposase
MDVSTERTGPLSVATTPEGSMREADEVTAMLRLHRLGWGTRRIAAALGCSRTTVQRYLSTGEWHPYRRTARARLLEPHMSWLTERFTRHRGNADVVRQDLAHELGVTVSLRTIERAVAPLRQALAAEARATVRFETPPGRQLQIDFGETRVLIGEETVHVHLFVATLGYSRRLFCQPFRHQRQSAWFAGLEASFRHFGGIPRDVLLDNPRALVDYHNVQTREVRFNAGFLAFARDWGFTPRACAPYRARTKGKDERGVGYVKHNAIAGHRFASWEALEAHLLAWTRDVADQRRHGTTEEAPRVRFDREGGIGAATTGRPRLVHRDAHGDALRRIGRHGGTGHQSLQRAVASDRHRGAGGGARRQSPHPRRFDRGRHPCRGVGTAPTGCASGALSGHARHRASGDGDAGPDGSGRR